MNAELEPFVGPDLESFIIVHQDDAGRPADASLCRAVRDGNGIENAVVLYDGEGLLDALSQTYGDDRLRGRHFHRVLREGAVLELEQQFVDSGYLEALEQLLR